MKSSSSVRIDSHNAFHKRPRWSNCIASRQCDLGPFPMNWEPHTFTCGRSTCCSDHFRISFSSIRWWWWWPILTPTHATRVFGDLWRSLNGRERRNTSLHVAHKTVRIFAGQIGAQSKEKVDHLFRLRDFTAIVLHRNLMVMNWSKYIARCFALPDEYRFLMMHVPWCWNDSLSRVFCCGCSLFRKEDRDPDKAAKRSKRWPILCDWQRDECPHIHIGKWMHLRLFRDEEHIEVDPRSERNEPIDLEWFCVHGCCWADHSVLGDMPEDGFGRWFKLIRDTRHNGCYRTMKIAADR